MTTPADIDALIERVWNVPDAQDGDPALCCDVLHALGFRVGKARKRWLSPFTGAWELPPFIVGSIDEAIAVLQEWRPDTWFMIGFGRSRDDEPICGCVLYAEGDRDLKTPLAEGEHDLFEACAITIAMLELRKRALVLQ